MRARAVGSGAAGAGGTLGRAMGRPARRLTTLSLCALLLVLAVGAVLVGLPWAYRGRILPRVSVDVVAVGGLPPAAAAARAAAAVDPTTTQLRVTHEGTVILEPTAADVGASPALAAALAAAEAAGRSPGVRGLHERVVLLAHGLAFPLSWEVDRDRLRAYLEPRLAHLLVPSTEPTWTLGQDGAFEFVPGRPGAGLALDELVATIGDRLAHRDPAPIPLQVVPVPPVTSDAEARAAEAVVSAVATRPLTLIGGEVSVAVPSDLLARWVGASADGQPTLDRAAIERYLRETVAAAVRRAPQDAQFAVEGARASAFTPPQDGQELAVADSTSAIVHGLAAGAEKVRLALRPVRPAVAVTPLMEQYGIRALVARGETDFSGSPKNRIHNIRVGAGKYHGLLVPPGAEFSFNENLGPVEAYTGFLPELVILADRTTPQYGGGLCQVSTTMFRAAVRAGVPITARRNHAYAVSYYGTPGFDATIYPPNPDLRFRNDTPGHLLIQTKIEGSKLRFEFWGMPDGRRVDIAGPFPFDRQSDGAVKARLERTVAKGGQTTRDEWLSTYKSPKLFPKVLAANAETETWEQRVARIAEKDRKAQEEFERKKRELLKRGSRPSAVGSRATPKATPRATPTPAAE